MTELNNIYDVIVIGGGPAGSTAGRLLSGLGYKAIIIDKARFPREKLCGGLTTNKTIKLIERVFSETESSLKEKGIINYIAKDYQIRCKKRLVFKNKKEMLFYFVDREVYDSFLLGKAAEAGAEIIQGDRVIGCNFDECEVKTESGKVIKGRYIIAADGVNSIIRNSLPDGHFNRKKWSRNLISAFEIFVQRDTLNSGELGRDLNGPVIFLKLLKLGFAWMFPREDRVAIGIGALYKRNRGGIREIFFQFLGEKGIKDPEKFKLKTHNLPGGYYIKKPVYKNTLLAGDAGGYVDPLLGEGIFYSQRTAELAGWAIHYNLTERRPLEKVYKRMLWKYVFPEFINEKFARIFAFYVSEKLMHYPAAFFFSVMGGLLQETLHGSRTNRGFVKRPVHESVKLTKLQKFLTRPDT